MTPRHLFAVGLTVLAADIVLGFIEDALHMPSPIVGITTGALTYALAVLYVVSHTR